jgi:hypothetical protein
MAAPGGLPVGQVGAETDLEAAVRPRRHPRALTAAQRAAIEQQAVAVATRCLECDGWSVKDVGTTQLRPGLHR